MSVYGGGGYGTPMEGGPKVRIDAISDAFRLFQANAGTWVISFLIASLISSVVVYLPMIFALPFLSSRDGVVVGSIIMLIGMLPAIAVGSWLTAGMSRMAVRQVRGEQIGISDLFSGQDIALNTFIANLLIGLGVNVASGLCLIPGLIVGGLWLMAQPIIADQRVGPIEAMTRSWEALKGDMWVATGIFSLLMLLFALSPLACGVGMLVMGPVLFLTQAVMYRDFFGGNTPPSYGQQYPQYPPQGPQPPPYNQGGYPGGYPPQQR